MTFALAALAALSLASAAPSDRASCLASVTPEDLLAAPDERELADYAACAELDGGRRDLCDGFSGGPKAASSDGKTHRVTGADGKTREESTFGVCVSRAPAYRFLALLVAGGPEERLRAEMKLILFDEKIPLEPALRTYLDIYRRKTLEGVERPDLAKIGFFNHVLGPDACEKVGPAKLRQECYYKAAALRALEAKDASLCLEDDLLCRTLVAGPASCRALGRRAVERHCDALFPERPAPSSPDRS